MLWEVSYTMIGTLVLAGASLVSGLIGVALLRKELLTQSSSIRRRKVPWPSLIFLASSYAWVWLLYGGIRENPILTPQEPSYKSIAVTSREAQLRGSGYKPNGGLSTATVINSSR